MKGEDLMELVHGVSLEARIKALAMPYNGHVADCNICRTGVLCERGLQLLREFNQQVTEAKR
jgi:hypothetical protein